MRRLRRYPDDGFSLIEVIVAIVILGIVASSALWFFINGMQTTSNLDRQQRAVSIATSAMENTFTVSPRLSATAGVSGLVVGRSSAEVNAAFAKFAGVDGVTGTYPLYDPAGVTGGGTLELFDTVSSANNVDYEVYTLVGACYRKQATAGAPQPCAKYGTYTAANEPPAASVPRGVARLLRVIVVVTWKPIGGECAATAGVCSYSVSTFVDPSVDLAWNRVVKPEAVDDPDYLYDPVTGTPPVYDLDVMKNDVLGSVRSNPVQPVAGYILDSTAGTVTFPSDGVLKYTPPNAAPGTWKSGHFPFKYQVFDRTGASSIATATITLKPKAVNDPVQTAAQGIPLNIDVLLNDLGSNKKIVITQGSKQGATVAANSSGTMVTYTPGNWGPDTFSYKFTTDQADLSSGEVTVTVNVDALTARAIYAEPPYSATSAVRTNITSYFLAANPGITDFTITGAPTPGTGSVYVDGKLYEGGSVTGKNIEFESPAATAGDWSFPFKVTIGGRTSDNTANAAIKVKKLLAAPVAKDDGVGWVYENGWHNYPPLSLSRRSPQPLYVGSNDDPTTWSSSDVTVTLGTISKNCGSWTTATPDATDLAAGRVQITPPGSDKSGCTAKYTLTRGGVSSTATINYNVSWN